MLLGLYLAVGGVALALYFTVGRKFRTSESMRRAEVQDYWRRASRSRIAAMREAVLVFLGIVRSAAWWPFAAVVASSAKGDTVEEINQRTRLNQYNHLDSAMLLAAVIAFIGLGWNLEDSTPVRVWLLLFLVILMLRHLSILFSADGYYATFRIRPGRPYIGFLLATAGDVICLLVIAIAVSTEVSRGRIEFDMEALRSVPLELLPQKVAQAVYGDWPNILTRQALVYADAVLVYFLLLTRVTRVDKFRRSDEDGLSVAMKYAAVGDFANAEKWIARGRGDRRAAQLSALVAVGVGRLPKAWEEMERFLKMYPGEVTADGIWSNLWIGTHRLPLDSERTWDLYLLGFQRGASDGTLAQAADGASFSMRIDLRELGQRLESHRIDKDLYPICCAMQLLVQGEIEGSLELLRSVADARSDWDGLVALALAAGIGLAVASTSSDEVTTGDPIAEQARRYRLYASTIASFVDTVAVIDISSLLPSQRNFLAHTLGHLLPVTSELQPRRVGQIEQLIVELLGIDPDRLNHWLIKQDALRKKVMGLTNPFSVVLDDEVARLSAPQPRRDRSTSGGDQLAVNPVNSGLTEDL
ncbi:hypothetical protein [Micromonospora sp. NPDC005197]|uniref:hypothetical protein n=1 Tax=Micromonospora sp. NPDC005197 TaxID=3157020 RepID=UPI0033B2A90D